MDPAVALIIAIGQKFVVELDSGILKPMNLRGALDNPSTIGLDHRTNRLVDRFALAGGAGDPREGQRRKADAGKIGFRGERLDRLGGDLPRRSGKLGLLGDLVGMDATRQSVVDGGIGDQKRTDDAGEGDAPRGPRLPEAWGLTLRASLA